MIAQPFQRKTFYLTFLLLLGLIYSLAAQPDMQSVQDHLQKLIDEEYLQGASVAYIQPNGDVRYFSFGDSVRSGVQFDKNTIYEIGSVSKTFTTLILARMVQEDIVLLDTPIDAILPDTLDIPAYQGKKITLLDLATHTSGLPRLPSNLNPEDSLNPYASYSVPQMYKFLDQYELPGPPGTQLEYSNLGVGLLGHLLALQKNTSYSELSHHYITKPLGMNDTEINLPTDKQKRFARPYNYDRKAEHWDMPALAGAGAIRSTTKDLATYLKAQIGFVNTSFDSALTMTHKIQFGKRESSKSKIGLAWLYNTKHDTIIFHNGGTGGFRSFIGWNVEKRTGIIILAAGTKSVDAIGMHMLDDRFKLEKIKEVVQLKPYFLERLTGVYTISPAFKIKIFKKNKCLMAKATGQKAYRIYPKSKTRFFYKNVNAEIEFISDDSGSINKLKLYQNGNASTGIKTKAN